MKYLRLIVALAASLLLAGGIAAPLTISACVGQQARQHAGVPALELAVDGVELDARAGGIPEEVIGPFVNALATKDRTVIAAECLPRWPLVKAAAEQGINLRQVMGQIGPGVAASKRERLVQFEAVLFKTAERL